MAYEIAGVFRRGKILVKYWYIKGDFLKTRSGRIGASDLPKMIPNPEKPTESLAGYEQTAITLYQEKIGLKKRDPAGLPAEMGHYLEAKDLELFIRYYASADAAKQFLTDVLTYEHTAERVGLDKVNPANYQNTAFRHHTQFYRDDMICHPDAIYDPVEVMPKKRSHDVTVTFDEPFIIEAKSAGYWSAHRPEGSIVRGYDPELKTWQGIPLKHYVQIQFQLALLEIKTAYLPLLYNTNQFDVWKINANKKHQGRFIDLAGKMAWHIKNRKSPGDMAMNAQDIIDSYPELGKDFVILNGEERDSAIEIAKKYKQAVTQRKRWEAAEKDAKDAMSVMLKDRPELRDGDGIISKWNKTNTGEKITKLSEIRAEDLATYRYLKRKGHLVPPKIGRTVSIPWKGDTE